MKVLLVNFVFITFFLSYTGYLKEIDKGYGIGDYATDFSLPDINGYEILEQMRAHPQAKNIPAIAVTAKAMMDDVERGERAGFDDYLVKPVMAAELLKSIELTWREY